MEAESKRAFASLQFRSFHLDYNPGEQRSDRFSVDERVQLKKNLSKKLVKSGVHKWGGGRGAVGPPTWPNC